MDPIKQKIAILKACGWTQLNFGSLTVWKHPETPKNGFTVVLDERDIIQGSFLPDYLNDLNAMHEAEKVLNMPQFMDYISELSLLVSHNKTSSPCGRTVTATAAQRAEAFLRTLNLWTTET